MTHLSPRSLLVLSSMLGLVLISAARADAICDQDPDFCPEPNYAAFWPSNLKPNNGGTCPGTGGDFYAFKCLAPESAPAPARLNCTPFETGLLCEAWPQADGALHYGWNVEGDIALNYQPNPVDASIFIDCDGGGSGTVSVAVISPGFATASASALAECEVQSNMGGIQITPGGPKK